MGDNKALTKEMSKAASELWGLYDRELKQMSLPAVIAEEIWKFLMYVPRSKIMASKKKLDDFLEEEELNTFWEL